MDHLEEEKEEEEATDTPSAVLQARARRVAGSPWNRLTLKPVMRWTPTTTIAVSR
jgi:hypothetical protein